MSAIKLTVMLVSIHCFHTYESCIELPKIEVPKVRMRGMASFYNAPYGDKGLRGSGIMANGEEIDSEAMVVATRTIPLDTWVLLEYKGKRLWAKSADRGPFGCTDEHGVWHIAIRPRNGCKYRGIMDLNFPVAQKLLGEDMKNGLNPILVRY